MLNVLLGGNLPPFGCVCIIVEKENKYLVLRTTRGNYTLPGGFMRWKELPVQAAVRECKEETGLQLHMRDVIGYHSNISRKLYRMSTFTVVFAAEVVSGELKGSIEGEPIWLDKCEFLARMKPNSKHLLDDYLRYQERSIGLNGTKVVSAAHE